MEPYYCMHPIDNYDVLCDDCYEEMLREEAAAEAEAEEHSLGLVFVREGKIVGKYGTLVHPKPDDYDVERLNKLGLSPHDIDNAPDFRFVDIRRESGKFFGNTVPDLELCTVARACGYDLSDYHDPVACAEACVSIAMKVLPEYAL